MTVLRGGSRRFVAGAVTLVAVTVTGCAPVMTTRYRAVPLTEVHVPTDELYRFELADGANVDMRVKQINYPMVSGQQASGAPTLIDTRDVRRVGVARQEKDEPATNIKHAVVGSLVYAALLLGVALLAVGASP